MILNKERWVEQDKRKFLDYMKSLERKEKQVWSQNLLKTESPVLALKTETMVQIAREIMKGNYLSFLDLRINEYYETIALYGMILSRMKSVDLFMRYLEPYLDFMNCWAHCDLMGFPNLTEQKSFYLTLSEKFRTDDRVMVRRLSLWILFQFVKDEGYLDLILNTLLNFSEEEEYYVIMMAGWLLSECIILHREPTLQFLNTHMLSKKIQNKGIQKCRESNRLTQTEKDYLLQYKVK